MSRVRVVICQVEDGGAGAEERTTEVARFDLPATDLDALTKEPGTGLDMLEEVTHQHGQAVLRGVLQAQWEATDAAAVAAHRRCSPPCGVAVRRDG